VAITTILVLQTFAGFVHVPASSAADQQFSQLAERYVDEFPELAPVAATALGDHRFDGKLDEVNADTRARSQAFYRRYLDEVTRIDRTKLSRAHQVDYSLLKHHLEAELWRLETLQEWAWNPLVYTELSGGAVYGLMARDFAPLRQRLNNVADRLEQFPRLFRQIRSTLEVERVPKPHAETAVQQNRGVLSVLGNMVRPHLGELPEAERKRLEHSMVTSRTAVEDHQRWLETELLPKSAGDFRLGADRYDTKLAFTLHTPLTRQEIRDRADQEMQRVRAEMYQVARNVYLQKYPLTEFPTNPSREYQQAIIRAALELACLDTPEPDDILETAKRSLRLTTKFVREKDLVTVPDDPVELIVMPEFQRGVSVAYCDSPGPLDVGQKTFYALAPLPEDWNSEQVQSFLREYNVRSIHDLTVHEAMPGHYVQLAHSNRYPGKLRAVLASGTFIEGWAVYTEQMMVEQGFLDGDPLMRLIALKWYLRGVANAIIDQAIHTEGATRDQVMRIMMEDTFQEEREAAAKWVRAQLTSTQLSTYFVGYLEHNDMREAAKAARGGDFHLKTYHDKVLSFGSPPVKFVRSLLLEEEIP
jgi:uncharacterized protein (DUF885 family)